MLTCHVTDGGKYRGLPAEKSRHAVSTLMWEVTRLSRQAMTYTRTVDTVSCGLHRDVMMCRFLIKTCGVSEAGRTCGQLVERRRNVMAC